MHGQTTLEANRKVWSGNRLRQIFLAQAFAEGLGQAGRYWPDQYHRLSYIRIITKSKRLRLIYNSCMGKSDLKLYYRGVKAILSEQFKANRLMMICLVAGKVLEGLRPLGEAYIVAKIITQFASLVSGQIDSSGVISWLIAWLTYRIITDLLSQGLSFMQIKIDNMIDIVVQRIIVKSMYQINIATLEDPEIQPILVRINQNSQMISNLIYSLLSIFTKLVTYISTFVALLYFSVVIGLAAVLIVIPLIWVQFRAVTLRRKNFDNIYADYRIKDSLGYFLTMPNHVLDIKTLGGVKELLGIYQRHSDRINQSSQSVAKKEISGEIIAESSQLMVQFLADLWLVFRAVSGGIGLSQIILARGLISNLVSSTGGMAGSIKNTAESLSYVVDIERLKELAYVNKSEVRSEIGHNQDLGIEFTRLDFHYPNQSDLEGQFSLQGLNFEIKSGQKLALVGENGAGKTSIIKLLLGFYTPTGGEIRVNGVSLENYSQKRYLENFTVMMQEYMIFDALSIRQNLLIGNLESIKDSQLWHILDTVRLGNLVRSLPNGLDSRLWVNVEGGINLSGGQKQRLGLARALLRRSKFLILDEPTAAVDARAEEGIIETIFADKGHQSILIVSHRLSTARRADKILFIDQGKVIEQGSHQELMSQRGAYFELFEKQAKGYQ